MTPQGYRAAVIKVRVYEGQEAMWEDFLLGRKQLTLTPTGYRDGTEAEFVIGTANVHLPKAYTND